MSDAERTYQKVIIGFRRDPQADNRPASYAKNFFFRIVVEISTVNLKKDAHLRSFEKVDYTLLILKMIDAATGVSALREIRKLILIILKWLKRVIIK
uniref:Uncharacterized protein n=1 Tax=Romanomermis culicivorax TaxID=13658 RepID=A0A915IJY7_ROMCU